MTNNKSHNPWDDFIHKALRLALWCWTIATLVFVAGNGTLYLLRGGNDFYALIREGPISRLPLTAASVALVWIALGGGLALLSNRRIRASYGIYVVCALLVVLLYANILRERTLYGDIGDYIRAAHNLVDRIPFHARYLYPPFLATVLAPLLPFGDGPIASLCWLANLISLGLFSVLLTFALARYGFDKRSSALVTLAFMVINVPILRTLGYIQVNLHIANLILIALLSYPRSSILSALALAVAVHLKVSPIILVLPFLLCRDWKWLAWFAVMTVGLAAVTLIPYGWRPFSDFLHNVRDVYSANGLQFRETSVDSLFRCTAMLIGIPLAKVSWAIAATKTGLLAAVLLTMARVVRNNTFMTSEQMRHSVFNAAPVLMMFMLVGSPLLWVHHPVIVALSYLLMLKRVETPFEWVAYGFAFFLEFHVPTFDFFPWSFMRLLSPLILIGLMYATSARTEEGSLWRWLAECKPVSANNG